jgi:hypothetical protein
MSKHIFWGLVVVELGFLGAYVSLVLTGHPSEANAIGGFAGGVLFVSFMLFVLAGF